METNDGAPAAVLASVVVLGVPEFARKPVTEQAALRVQLEALAAAAIRRLPAAVRIVLDAVDALGVVVLDGPETALLLAQRARAAAGGLALRIGLNYGPVTAADDPVRGTCLAGDGLDAAFALARATAPGDLLASRPFRDALAASSPSRAATLGAAGEITDDAVRSHEAFRVDPAAVAVGRRRRTAFAAAAAAAFLGVGVAARVSRLPPPPPPPAPPPKPAVLRFEIAPHGEVYVDGRMKGRTPPLAQFEVSPGLHTVEVREADLAPLRVEVNLAAAQEMTIRHTFVAAKKKPKVEKHGTQNAKAERSEKPKSGNYWRENIKSEYENMRHKLGF